MTNSATAPDGHGRRARAAPSRATRANQSTASRVPEVHLQAHADGDRAGHQQDPVALVLADDGDLLGATR